MQLKKQRYDYGEIQKRKTQTAVSMQTAKEKAPINVKGKTGQCDDANGILENNNWQSYENQE